MGIFTDTLRSGSDKPITTTIFTEQGKRLAQVRKYPAKIIVLDSNKEEIMTFPGDAHYGKVLEFVIHYLKEKECSDKNRKLGSRYAEM